MANPARLCRFAPCMEVPTLLADEVRGLAARAVERGSVIAFQSTLAAAAQAVQQALQHEEAVSQAALSLAQQGTLGEMTEELRVVRAALESSLDRQGQCLMPAGAAAKKRTFRFPARASRQDQAPLRPTWSRSLSDAVEALETGADSMAALASGQPDDAPSRVLGTATSGLLRDHHDRLAAEAERLV